MRASEPRCNKAALRPVAGVTEGELLRLAASLEQGSEHPLAAVIVRSATERKLALAKVEDFDSPPGKGVTGSVEGRELVRGNRMIMQAAGIDVSAREGPADELRDDGATVIFAALDGKASAVIAIADPSSRRPRRRCARSKRRVSAW